MIKNIFAENVDPKAMRQFDEAMESKGVKVGALMPDVHAGYTLPIGAVVATDTHVYPSWVGYDIGCGMLAAKTTFRVDDVREHAEDIYESIFENVPVGFNMHEGPLDSSLDPNGLTHRGQMALSARGGFRALGTLGGGNHFIEIGEGNGFGAWIIIHSGSRGPGHGLATEYMKLASNSDRPVEGNFGFLADCNYGRDYLNDMYWMLGFALGNRYNMMYAVEEALQRHCTGWVSHVDIINRNHNHISEKDGMFIHRKGATHAEAGMMGVIPGNMRDGSFIVKGKGNPSSLWSSSHGAGRVLGRNQAKRTLSLEDFEESMDGVVANVHAGSLDESPAAYKSIFEVMRQQANLVEVVDHVKPIINVKG